MTRTSSLALAPMSERYRRPDWVRRLNGMAEAVGGDPRRLVPIEAEDLMHSAERALGPGPFGDLGDARWRERFAALVGALDAAPMHVLGRLMTKQELLRSLRTRLLLARRFEDHPEIERESIDAPIVITGPARSGTTIFFELFWLDPDLRAPTAFEALHPAAPPDIEGFEGRRLELGECEQEFWADVQPEFAAIHELRSDLPVECVTLTMPSFCGPHWVMVAQLEGWAPDVGPMYGFHRRILQVLQHAAEPRSWLLKTPGHLYTLEALFDAYPDAWVVQTHRDPVRTMPSTVSTAAVMQWMRTDDVDIGALANAVQSVFAYGLNHTVELRSGASVPSRFVDVHFQSLMRDPVGTLRSAYECMGRPFRREHAERIERYLREKPRGKFGRHSYSADEWGFEEAALREALAPYVEHFGIEPEPSSSTGADVARAGDDGR